MLSYLSISLPWSDCGSVFISFQNIKFPFQFRVLNDELLSADGVREAAWPVIFILFFSVLHHSALQSDLEIEGSRHVLDIKLGPRISDFSRGAGSRVGGWPIVTAALWEDVSGNWSQRFCLLLRRKCETWRFCVLRWCIAAILWLQWMHLASWHGTT